MPKGIIQCPICKGTGILKENSEQYEFISREPNSGRCLFCNGSGWVSPLKKFPDGSRAVPPKKKFKDKELRKTLFGKPEPEIAQKAGDQPASDLEQLIEAVEEIKLSPTPEGREPSVIIIIPNKGKVGEILSRFLMEVLNA